MAVKRPTPPGRFGNLRYDPVKKTFLDEAGVDVRTKHARSPGLAILEGAALGIAGSSVASQVPGGPKAYIDPLDLGLSALGVIPVVRGPRAAVAGIRAATKGEAVRPAVKAGYNKRIFKFGGDKAPRFMTYRDGQIQMPAYGSIVTNKVVRMMDSMASSAGRKADVLRESESALARGVGKAITPISSRARAVNRAGRLEVRETGRARAAAKQHIDVIRAEPETTAHHWWAQMDDDFHNAEGLERVSARLGDEAEYWQSGRAKGEIDTRLVELDAEIKAAQDPKARFELIEEAGDLKALRAREPEIARDLTNQIAELDGAIARGVMPNEDVITSLRVLADDRKQSLIGAGKLDPERAVNREGMVARWLGLEPTGREIYMGHRIGPVRGAKESLQSSYGPGLGASRLPEGVFKSTQLRAINRGSQRTDLDVAIEDWQSSQVYAFHNGAKETLGQFGQKVDDVLAARGERRLRRDDIVLNPRGKPNPKRDPENPVTAHEEDELVDDIEEYVTTYAGEYGRNGRDILDAAVREGRYDDLVVIPNDVYARFRRQWMDPRLLKRFEKDFPGLQQIGKGAGLVHDLMYLSIIYANPGYIPANAFANLIMSSLKQGPFLLPFNLSRAGQMMMGSGANKDVLNMMREEVGNSAQAIFEAGRAMPDNTVRGLGGAAVRGDLDAARGLVKKASRPATLAADDIFRLSAFLHEAAKKGVISKVSMHLDGADWQGLRTLLSDPAMRGKLNDIRDAANRQMVNFDRLGPLDKMLGKKLGFVWGWMRAGTAYPFEFVMDNPLRSAAMAAGAYYYFPELTGDEQPPWLRQAVKTGSTVVNGKEYPSLWRTTSFSPVSTPYEAIGTVVNREGSSTIMDQFANPMIEGAFRMVAEKDQYWQPEESRLHNLAEIGLGMTPNVGLAKDLISPPDEGGLYPEDITRWGRARRALRLFKIAIDPDEAEKLGEKYQDIDRFDIDDLRADQAKLRNQFKSQAAKFDIPLTPEADRIMEAHDNISVARVRLLKQNKRLRTLDKKDSYNPAKPDESDNRTYDEETEWKKSNLKSKMRVAEEMWDIAIPQERWDYIDAIDSLALVKLIESEIDDYLGFNDFSELKSQIRDLQEIEDMEKSVAGGDVGE